MAFNFLALPRETRDSIYGHATTPTGRIQLIPPSTSSNLGPRVSTFNDINHSFYQTNRQINTEFGEQFYRNTTFCVAVRPDPTPLWISLGHRTTKDIQRIELAFPMTADNIRKVLLWNLSLIEHWVRQPGELREVTLTAHGEEALRRIGGYVEIQKDPKLVMAGYSRHSPDIFELLRRVREISKKGNCPELKISLNLQLSLRYPPTASDRQWLDKHTPEECEGILEAMQKTLGGNIYVDDVLCYRDHVRIRETFADWQGTKP